MRPRIPPPCDLTLGLTCVDKEEAGVTVWEAQADERFANPNNAVQGGILGAIADSAMAASAITFYRPDRVRVANVELKITFLRPAPVGGTLVCTARVVSGGRRIAFLEADVTDRAGTVFARASSTFVISPAERLGPGKNRLLPVK